MAESRGLWLENKMISFSELLMSKNVGIFHKIPTPNLAFSKTKSSFVGKAPIDFFGQIQGQAIYLEAKSVYQKERFSFSSLREEQRTLLHQVSSLGAFAFLCIGFRLGFEEEETIFLINILDMEKIEKEVNAKSIRFDQLERFAFLLYRDRTWYFEDFLRLVNCTTSMVYSR